MPPLAHSSLGGGISREPIAHGSYGSPGKGKGGRSPQPPLSEEVPSVINAELRAGPGNPYPYAGSASEGVQGPGDITGGPHPYASSSMSYDTPEQLEMLLQTSRGDGVVRGDGNYGAKGPHTGTDRLATTPYRHRPDLIGIEHGLDLHHITDLAGTRLDPPPGSYTPVGPVRV
jgi:hypothetical protein